jgi:hypothetical protein
MTNTRNYNTNAENNVGNNNTENNNAANPPPPPPPTLEQVLAMQAQMLQTMVNMENAQPQAPPRPSRDRLGDFQCTKLLTFSHVVEPMDADIWLMYVKKKLQVVQYNNHEKVLLGSHQLSGPTTDWWDAYREAYEELESINWHEFRAAVRAHHVPQGVIKLKKKEFLDLKQVSMSVNVYVTKFTQLSRYAPNEVDTEEKKLKCFLNGLNDGLAYALEARDFENLQGMVNKVLVLGNHRGVMERKRKLVGQHQPCSSSRPRVASSLAGHVSCPAQP